MENEQILSHEQIIRRRQIFTAVKYFCLVALGIFFVFPFLYLFTSSFMSDEQILNTTSIIPKELSFESYKTLFEHAELLIYVKNTYFEVKLKLLNNNKTYFYKF